MIFITVGTGEFDKLVKQIDSLVGRGRIKKKVLIQIGRSKYKPKNCKYFDFAPDLDKYYEKASLVISHGGPGTVFEILDKGKKLIAVPNRDRTDPRHQVEFLEGISKESKALLYCNYYNKIGSFIEIAKKFKFTKYKKPKCDMARRVEEFLK